MFLQNSLRSVNNRLGQEIRRSVSHRIPGIYRGPIPGKEIFHQITLREAWLSDQGAWPIISILIGSVIFVAGSGIYITASSPDARLRKSDRKSIFRGDLRNDGYHVK
mmetsp:Transcript_10207/g.9895  ORF Transcript_10207/g.9895 Transcript_10207/m.9895 type:complete len:107 (-) Transcript_10207:253-573(-)